MMYPRPRPTRGPELPIRKPETAAISSIRCTVGFVVLLLCCQAASAANLFSGTDDPENFHVEITASAFLLSTHGNFQASGTSIDLVHDLAIEQQQPTFDGQFVFKPARKHRIIVEGMPISLSGNNTIQRQIVYLNRTFNVSETVHSSGTLTYLFAGYQYDVLSRPSGHWGFSVGATYLNASGTLSTVPAAISESGSQQVPLPVAGTEFRIFPIPRHPVVEFDGGIRGMQYGGYGYFLEGKAEAGVCLGPFSFLAGYRELHASIHNTNQAADGANVHLRGPLFSLVWRH